MSYVDNLRKQWELADRYAANVMRGNSRDPALDKIMTEIESEWQKGKALNITQRTALLQKDIHKQISNFRLITDDKYLPTGILTTLEDLIDSLCKKYHLYDPPPELATEHGEVVWLKPEWRVDAKTPSQNTAAGPDQPRP